MNQSGSARLPVVLFSSTLFLSAFLLFSVQPMVGKSVLPLLGGTPAVWNACMMFFQAGLLAGYAYAHLATTRLGARRQAGLHLFVLLLPVLSLPIGVPEGWTPPTDAHPLPWLLLVLLLRVGLPFFVISASAPLLQKWFADTDHPSARDPYFLYAASNLGSFAALISYPTLIEPMLPLLMQSRLWAVGYWAFALLIVGCAQLLWSSRAPASAPSRVEPAAPLSVTRRLWWLLLSFVPSSLLLGVTTYLSTDIAAIPLLWIVPLALYLVSFVLVFATRPPIPHALIVRLLPIAILPLCIAFILQATEPAWWLILLHVLVFFAIAMVCHGELAHDRPPTQHLTEFYLWMSIGGVLGGVFNALLAPLLFDMVIEYPLMIVLACLLRPGSRRGAPRPRVTWMDAVWPGVLGVLMVALALGARTLQLKSTVLVHIVLFGIPALFCYSFRSRPVRFGLGVGTLLLVGVVGTTSGRNLLHQERSFFGIYRVVREADRVTLSHGTTLHGLQSLHPAHALEPLSYFHSTGPLGDIMRVVHADAPGSPVAVVGLGTGSMACYAEPGQRWTFYEIDPLVVRIATTPRYFTFLRDCPGTYDLVLGDARLTLAQAPSHRYGLIIVDAFSSDAIPVHLMTREAIRLYFDKLTPHGLLGFHISNRYLRLEPVFGDAATAEGLIAFYRPDGRITKPLAKLGKLASDWVVLARRSKDMGALADNPRWKTLNPRAQTRVWTDDFSNVFSAFRWR